MIRLLFVVFVCLGGFAALALWNARGGDAEVVVRKVLPGGAADSVQTEVERLEASLATLLPKPAPIRGETVGDGRTAPHAGDTAPGSLGAVAMATPEPTASEPDGAENILAESRAEVAPIEVHDVEPPGELARDLEEGDGFAEAGDSAHAADQLANEPGLDAASLDEVVEAASSAGLVRRMLAVYSRTRERR